MKKFFAKLKPIFRKKSTILIFSLMGIVMALTILIQTYNKSVYNGFYGPIKENIDVNTFSVAKTYDEKIPFNEFKENMQNELASIPHVIGVFHGTSRINGGTAKKFAKNESINGRIEFFAGNNQTLPQILQGTNFPDEDGFYMVCPKNFIPGSYSISEYSRFDMVNLEEYLGKEISFNYYDFDDVPEELEIKIKLVGISKNNSSMNDENKCYVTESTLKEMHYNQIKKFLDTYNEVENNFFYIQIDSIDNKDEVYQSIKELGYYDMVPTIEMAYDVYDEMVANIKNITIVVNVIIFILLFLIIILQYYNSKKYYKLLKYLGYDKSSICWVNIVSNLILIIFSSIITLIVSCLMKYILNIIVYFKPAIFWKWDIIMDYSSLFFIIPLAIFTTIIVSLIIIFDLTNNVDN